MKKVVIILGIALVLVVVYLAYYMMFYTKTFSPEANVDFTDGSLKVHVFYNRPYKKGREIFGNLVPYGKTWRTGANEASVFETTSDLKFGDKELKAGKYSLWTVPGEQTWQVIFNSEIPWWGMNFNGLVNRNLATDALIVEAQVHPQEKEFEQFTILVEKGSDGYELNLIWDKTLVNVPFTIK